MKPRSQETSSQDPRPEAAHAVSSDSELELSVPDWLIEHPEALRALILEAVASLAANPKEIKFHRAISHTCIEPAPTQERAAELLGLPFNTYRYHLANGIERITDWLWQRELNGASN